MTKQEFIAAVSQRSGLATRDAQKAVDAFLDTITDTLKSGGDVAFTGFGKFSAADRAARQGVNPRTGERVEIAATRVPEVLGRKPVEGRGQGLVRARSRAATEGRAARGAAFLFRLRTNIRSPRIRPCSSRWMPPTGSSSWWRSGGRRCPSRRRRGRSSRSRTCPEGMARSLLDDVVAGDARLAWRGGCVGLADDRAERVLLEDATVRRRRPRDDRAVAGTLADLRDRRREGRGARARRDVPDARQPAQRSARDRGAHRDRRRRAPRRAAARAAASASWRSPATPSSSPTTRASTSSFLDREVERLTGRRLAGAGRRHRLARARLLAGRAPRVGLASLAHFFGTRAAVPPGAARRAGDRRDPRPLIGLAQERGARTRRRPRRARRAAARRVYGKRSLAFGAPTRPGVYLFRDAHDQVLYVGRARDLRARLRSYFRSERQRPAVEAALAAVDGSNGECSAPSSRRRSRSCA